MKKLFTLVSFFAAAASFAAPPSALNKAEGVCTFGDYTVTLLKMTPLTAPSANPKIHKVITIEKGGKLAGALVAKFQPDNGENGSDPGYLYTAKDFSMRVSLTTPPGVTKYLTYLTVNKGSVQLKNVQGFCEFAAAADLEVIE
jgi:hypothetical protein